MKIIFMRVLFCKIHCSSFFCFCKPSAHLYTPGPLKLENTPHVPPVVISVTDTSDQLSGEITEVKEWSLDGIKVQNDEIGLKSCIRKVNVESAATKEIERKKVQWIDSLGKELAEIKDFESSETGDSDSEEDSRGCVCTIL